MLALVSIGRLRLAARDCRNEWRRCDLEPPARRLQARPRYSRLDGDEAIAESNSLTRTSVRAIERVLSGHRRAVNRICWHTTDWNVLISGSQDGTIKIWVRTRPDAQVVSQNVWDVV